MASQLGAGYRRKRESGDIPPYHGTYAELKISTTLLKEKRGASFVKYLSEEVLTAYKWVKAKHGAGGVDGVEIKQFENKQKDNLYKLWNQMAPAVTFPKW